VALMMEAVWPHPNSMMDCDLVILVAWNLVSVQSLPTAAAAPALLGAAAAVSVTSVDVPSKGDQEKS